MKASADVYETDSRGRKITDCNGNNKDDSNHYVCDEKLVVPRYLVEFYSK